MRFRSYVFALCAAVPLTVAALAAPPAGADKCPPRPGMMMFTQEQRLMMFADIKAQADAGAIDPQVARQMQRDKMKAMSDEQRKTYADNLTKRWNALSPAEQMKLKAEALKWRASHPRPEGGDRPHCRPEH